MRGAGVRVGVGTRFNYDGEAAEVVEITTSRAGPRLLGMGAVHAVDPDTTVKELARLFTIGLDTHSTTRSRTP